MLIGVGLGPGDPELLTLKAVRLLREADRVFVPGRIAWELVSDYCEPVLLDFPMTEDEPEVRRSMQRNASLIAPAARDGLAVLGILGDPNFFSTFSRLAAMMAEMYPGIECRTVPGVSAITAFASLAGVSLRGSFLVTDGGNDAHRVVLKVKEPKKMAERLRDEGYCHFVLLERMFLSGMKIYHEEELPTTSDYMSVLYAGR
ncbi:MAG: cobalt-factor II C(20)-methyltransferase [Methanomicrobiales archaeon]|nr:cobalt-factor II C(20)-methyltransferase [Methanomicrobiales archaeon]